MTVKFQEGRAEETQSQGEGTGLGEKGKRAREGLEVSGMKPGVPAFPRAGNKGHLLE